MGVGIAVADNAKASIDQVICSGNDTGVMFVEETTGAIRNSTVVSNQEAGIAILGSAQVDVVKNTIENNGSVGVYFQLEAAGGVVRDNVLARNDTSGSGLGTDIQIWEEYSPELIGNSCDKQRQFSGSGDLSGIVFIARGSLPTNPTLQGNACAVARCSTPTGSLISMTCE